MHCSSSCLECGVNFAEAPGFPCQIMNQLVLQWEHVQTGWARVEEDRGPPGSIASPSVIHTGPISKSAPCMYGAWHCHLMSGCMMLGDQAVFTACSSLEQSVARVLEGWKSSKPSRSPSKAFRQDDWKNTGLTLTVSHCLCGSLFALIDFLQISWGVQVLPTSFLSLQRSTFQTLSLSVCLSLFHVFFTSLPPLSPSFFSHL